MATATLTLANLEKVTLNELGLNAKHYLMYRMPYEPQQLASIDAIAIEAAWEGACNTLGSPDARIMRQITDAKVMRRLMSDALNKRPRQH